MNSLFLSTISSQFFIITFPGSLELNNHTSYPQNTYRKLYEVSELVVDKITAVYPILSSLD